MSFATALSGLSAAQNDLSVTGNNIANANTTGFKSSRSEFADVYASTFGSVSSTQPGNGVKVADVAQQFSQGNIETTQNSLDLALSGSGFFALSNNLNASAPDLYTRSGAFKLNQDGYVVSDQGNYLMAYAPNGTSASDGFSQGVFQPLKIDTTQGLPKATQKVGLQVNLDSSASKLLPASFNPSDSTTYDNMTSTTIYDSQGNSHKLTEYFVADGTTSSTSSSTVANPNSWKVYTYLDGKGIDQNGTVTSGVPTATTLKFDTAGALLSVDGNTTTKESFGPVDLSNINPNLKVDPMSVQVDFAKSTQYSTPFSVNAQTQDGLPTGNLTGINVNSQGIVTAQYSNGASQPLGQVALARFPNDQGLAKAGDTAWTQSPDSGQAVFGAAGSNNFGTVQSSALESSNVDLSSQLVKLIVAQQAYEANSKTISTDNQIVQTVLNIR